MRATVILAFLVISAGLSHAQEQPHWQAYRNPVYGFQIDLPYGQFVPQPSPTTASSLTLLESDGPGEISVYGGQNIHGADPAKLASVLGGADRVQAVTYRAEGNSWLVLSGYYKGATANTARVIFYAKLGFRITDFEAREFGSVPIEHVAIPGPSSATPTEPFPNLAEKPLDPSPKRSPSPPGR